MELLKKHFDTALESPNGIKKLRELILTLAMQGKLVSQDPKDQPASEFLKEIQAGKERLIIKGKIKKQKELPPIKPEEVPYEVPGGWVWTRLSLIGQIVGGGTPSMSKKEYWGGQILWVSPKDMKSNDIFDSEMKITQLGVDNSSAKIIPIDSIITVGRSGILKRKLPVAINKVECSLNQDMKAVIPYYKGISTYLQAMLFGLEPIILKKFVKFGMTVHSLRYDEFALMPIPIPPLAEQKRIVAKIDELMALCDKLEAQRKARNDKRLAVHTSAIIRLQTAADKNDFDTSWQFISRHFDALYSVKENVAELKKTILTLAMQGKLVNQDPNDQPAIELLKKIQAEKERLIKEGKIKNQKELPPIKPEEVPYEVPEGWVWTRLGNVGETQTGTTPRNGDNDSYGVDYPFIKPADIFSNFVNYNNEGLSELGVRKYGRLAKAGSSLMVCIGTIGKTNIIEKDCSFNQQINSITPSNGLSPYFIQLFLKSSFFQEKAWYLSSSTTLAILNKGKWESIEVALPPLAEQKRIVARIDELMALCNKLENQIDQATAKQTALFDAVLAEV